eukprot:6410781-Pyramimonas_sp.AAC.1
MSSSVRRRAPSCWRAPSHADIGPLAAASWALSVHLLGGRFIAAPSSASIRRVGWKALRAAGALWALWRSTRVRCGCDS